MTTKSKAPKTPNSDVQTPYIWASAKYTSSLFEKRIISKTLEIIYNADKDIPLSENEEIRKVDFDQNDHMYLLQFPISHIEDQRHYQQIKDALIGLKRTTVVFDIEDGYIIEGLVSRIIANTEKGLLQFYISKEVYNSYLDYTKGYRYVNIKTLLSLKSIYSMRIYELISCKSDPITYNIDSLKTMFNIETKYKRNTDIVRFVINKAKEELDSSAPWSFAYKVIKKGNRIHAITFIPYRTTAGKEKDLLKEGQNVSIIHSIPRDIRDHLKYVFGFDTAELKRNRATFEALTELRPDDFGDQILQVCQTALRKRDEIQNLKGYIISSLKSLVSYYEQQKNIQEILNMK